jgi:uncharacterized protein involved in response to NO
MVWAFLFILLAGVVRSFVPILLPQFSLLSYQVSGALWLISYGMFVAVYLPILSKARIDGRPG